MRKSRFTGPQIIGFLKQAESGLPVKDVCRQGGFSEPTFYKWRPTTCSRRSASASPIRHGSRKMPPRRRQGSAEVPVSGRVFVPNLFLACLRSQQKRRKAAMKLGYTIIYVPNVAASLRFFEQAFGVKQKFLHESGAYGELDTGATTLAFAAHELGDVNFPGGHVHADQSDRPLGFEVAFVTSDVHAAHSRATQAGALELAEPRVKPWGQTVSYVRCPDGILVELCSPVAG